MYCHGTWTQWSLGSHTCDLNRHGVKGHLGVSDLWFKFLAKRFSVSTYFDVFSNLILQRLQKYVIAKAGETRGSRTTLLYSEVEAPKAVNLIMFRNSSLTFSAKIRKNQGAFLSNKPFYAFTVQVKAPSMGPFPIEMHTKHFFLKTPISKKCTLIFFHIFAQNFHWLFRRVYLK